jgi:catechol-2,3-dioxygenase
MQFSEVILETTSLQKTKLFYRKTLELAIAAESVDTVSFTAGKTTLTFRETKERKPFYHFAFNVTNNKFSDCFEWLNNKLDIIITASGLPITSYPDWNAESFYFYDNNGSIIEFIARFDLPYNSDAPFSPHDIREISEVGITGNDIPALASTLNAKYTIPYFSKSKPSEHFTAMGDDHGLLILSQSGRPWVPTRKACEHFPIIVVADGQQITL